MNDINLGQSQINSFSAQVIRLRQGFVAEQGSEFRAYIDNMPYCDKTDEEIAIVLPDDQTTNVKEITYHNEDLSMKVYPNPSRGIITIVLPEHGKYCIYNQLGQVVKVFEINEGGSLEVSAEILGAGFFYLVCMDKNIKPVKFIINK